MFLNETFLYLRGKKNPVVKMRTNSGVLPRSMPLILVVMMAIYFAIIVNGLANPPLFNDVSPSVLPVARETYYQVVNGHLTLRAGAPGYIPYDPDRPDSSSVFFVAVMIDKEGWEESYWDMTTYYDINYYSQSNIYKPWNDYYVWVKWNYTDMVDEDLYTIQNAGWILQSEQIGNNGYKYSYSVSINAGTVSGTITVYLTPMSGSQGDSDNVIDAGWIYLGHAKNWRSNDDFSHDEYVSKAILKMLGDNAYLKQHDNKALLIKIKVVPWWLYNEFWEDAADPTQWGTETYYWGVIYYFTLGDNIDAGSGNGNDDCYIIVAPGSSTNYYG